MNMLKKLYGALLILLIAISAVSAKDLRAVKISKFLDNYPANPLRAHVHEILYCADQFGLDYRLYLALACAESGMGRFCPKYSRNFTGIMNGATGFRSIFANIHYTHRLIATGKWYRRYQATRRLADLVYVYKHVPPFEPYLRTMRYVLDGINSVDLAEEKKALEAERKKIMQETIANWSKVRYDQCPAGQHDLAKVEKQQVQNKILMAWNEIRYDRYPRRMTISCNPLND
jgi:hypothetical protein